MFPNQACVVVNEYLTSFINLGIRLTFSQLMFCYASAGSGDDVESIKTSIVKPQKRTHHSRIPSSRNKLHLERANLRSELRRLFSDMRAGLMAGMAFYLKTREKKQ